MLTHEHVGVPAPTFPTVDTRFSRLCDHGGIPEMGRATTCFIPANTSIVCRRRSNQRGDVLMAPNSVTFGEIPASPVSS